MKIRYLLFPFFLLVFSAVIYSQDSICSVVSRESTCVEWKEGDTIAVYSDALLFGRGISFCPQEVGGYGGTVQLMLCLDQSSSMGITDPGKKLVDVALALIDSLKNRSPNSWVGIYNFSLTDGGNPLDIRTPLQLNTPENIDSIRQVIIYSGQHHGGSTLYRFAMDSTISWFNQLPLDTNRVVVFLSDGAPSDFSQARTRFPFLPPTHTIYFHPGYPLPGDSLATANLFLIADTTGGTFNDVDNAQYLYTVFLDDLLGRMLPTLGVRNFYIQNKTTGDLIFGEIIDSSLTHPYVRFPALSLAPGVNEVTFAYEQEIPDSTLYVYKTMWIDRKSGPLNPGEQAEFDSLFEKKCAQQSQTWFLDSLHAPLLAGAGYDASYDSVRVQVFRGPSEDIVQVDSVFILSLVSNDREYVKITEINANADIYHGAIPLRRGGAAMFDNVVEVSVTDTLIVRYFNPAFYTIDGQFQDRSFDTVVVNYIEDVDRIELWSKAGNPSQLIGTYYNAGGDLYDPLPAEIVMSADDTLKLYGKCFSRFGTWLGSYAGQDTIALQWVIGSDFTGGIDSLLPQTSPFFGFWRHQPGTGSIIARWWITGQGWIGDTVRVRVTAGAPYQLSIETSADGNGTDIDTLQIFADESTKVVFAVGRDRYGNYTGPILGDWSVLTSGYVTLLPPSTATSEGRIRRVLSGVVGRVGVSWGSLWDDIYLDIADYYITGVRIANQYGFPLEDSTVQSNDSLILRLQGQKSSDGMWIDVDGEWRLFGLLDEQLGAGQTQVGNLFTFRPRGAGSGILYSFMFGKPALYDSIPISVNPELPTRYVLRAIRLTDSTETGQVTAGEPFGIKVEAYNSDGLYPADILNWGMTWSSNLSASASNTNLGYHHQITGSGEVSGILGITPVLVGIDLRAGVGYAGVIVYNADSDPLYIRGMDNRGIIDSTQPVTVLDGPIAELQIENISNTAVESLWIANNGQNFVVYSRGYDSYGNSLGDVRAVWATSGEIDTLKPEQVGPTTYLDYKPSRSPGFVEGQVIATSFIDPSKMDSIYVYIVDSTKAIFFSAVTRDTNGNGYLDRIDLLYNEEVRINGVIGIGEAFTIFGGRKHYLVVGAEPLYQTTQHVSLIIEEHSQPPLETDETPRITLKDEIWSRLYLEGATIPDEINANDGAGPVIDSAEIQTQSTLNPNDDVITVVWSEDIKLPSVAKSDANQIFQVWWSSGMDTLSNTLELRGNYLASCPVHLYIETSDFTMANGKTITSAYWLSIDSLQSEIKDVRGNAVLRNNRKVRLKYAPVDMFFIDPILYPNPLTYSELRAGSQQPRFRFILFKKCKVTIQIYDLAGNLVRILNLPVQEYAQDYRTGVTHYIPWDGRNGKGKAVSRGGYITRFFAEPLDDKGVKPASATFKMGIR